MFKFKVHKYFNSPFYYRRAKRFTIHSKSYRTVRTRGYFERISSGQKDNVKSAILIKFKVLPKELEEKIESTDDIKALDEMFKKVILASKIEEIL